MSQLVTFLTVPANAISHTARASGELLSYKMIVGIEVGKHSVRFQHPDYQVQVDSEAKEAREQIVVPTLMAARLISFANACFVKHETDYDGADFTGYVSGLQPTPQHRSHKLRLSTVKVGAVEEMAYHVIGTETGEVIHAFIGLKEQHALTVHGLRGTFGISQVNDLMRVYGGVMLGRLKSV